MPCRPCSEHSRRSRSTCAPVDRHPELAPSSKLKDEKRGTGLLDKASSSREEEADKRLSHLELVLEEILLVGDLAIHAQEALLVRAKGLDARGSQQSKGDGAENMGNGP